MIIHNRVNAFKPSFTYVHHLYQMYTTGRVSSPSCITVLTRALEMSAMLKTKPDNSDSVGH